GAFSAQGTMGDLGGNTVAWWTPRRTLALEPTPTAYAPASLRLLARLSASVRGAADKAAYLMGGKSPDRPLPDSDGQQIRGTGRSQPVRGSDGKVTAALRWKP